MKSTYPFLCCLLMVLGCRKEPSSAPTETQAPVTTKDTAPPAMVDWLTEITADECGLDFVHEPWTEDYYFMPEMTAPGSALFDYDGDGDLDIYLVNSASGPESPTEPAARPVNRMFEQVAPMQFQDVTVRSGLGDEGYGIGAAVGDVDNDGDRDVYITNFGPDVLYLNDGAGRFVPAGAASGLTNPHWSCSATFVDIDRDGWLDLYVANYVVPSLDRMCADASGRRDFCGPQVFPGVMDTLYHNRGDGTFEDVTVASGIATRTGKGLGVVGRDFNGDGALDIYVANDGEPNFLWINDGTGHFEDVAFEVGAAVNESGKPEASMGLAVGDYDGDGDEDLFMTHLASETNTLYRNDRGLFDIRTAPAGLGTSSAAYTGFGTAFVDLDHDRDLDLLVVNGRVKRSSTPFPGAAAGPFWDDYAEANQMFENLGGGRFADRSPTSDFGTRVEVSRGLATGDLDGDGDLDAIVSNCKGPVRVFRNDGARGHWLMVRVTDPALGGRDVYGARIIVRSGDRDIIRTVHADGSYASSVDSRVHVGLGDADSIESLTVEWLDGMSQTFTAVPVDRHLVVRKGQETLDDD